MLARNLIVAALSLTTALADAKRWWVYHYNYCSSDITMVFSNRWPSIYPDFQFATASANGGVSYAWFEDPNDQFQDYSTMVTAVKEGSTYTTGSSVEFTLQGQYDVTAANGWNVPILIQPGTDASVQLYEDPYCTRAQCNSSNQHYCSDLYQHDNGLLSFNRQGDDTTKPNHFCPRDDFNVIRIQTCGQDSGSAKHLFGSPCGFDFCDNQSDVGASMMATKGKSAAKVKPLSKPPKGDHKVVNSGSSSSK
jgi:hypothetical protein